MGGGGTVVVVSTSVVMEEAVEVDEDDAVVWVVEVGATLVEVVSPEDSSSGSVLVHAANSANATVPTASIRRCITLPYPRITVGP